MTITVSHGTFRVGSWARNNDSYMWTSQTDDPYSYLLVPANELDEPSNMNAKNYVACFDDDHIFEFLYGKMTWHERVRAYNEISLADQDPIKFAEYYKENIHNKKISNLFSSASTEEAYPCAHYTCVDPFCLYHSLQETSNPPIISACGSCHKFTAVLDGLECDAAFMALTMRRMNDYVIRANVYNRLFDLVDSNDHVKIAVRGRRLFLLLDNEIPQLRVGGNHFIRGRVNREVLAEQGVRAEEKILIQLPNLSLDIIKILERLLSSESIILDPSKADKFRDEYIDSRWSEEFSNFTNELRESGLLKVDSAGLHETLTALYNMTQRKNNFKTIIKRDGSIKFPTTEIVCHIKPRLCARAFMATEHGLYDSPTDVFNIEMED